MRVSGAHTPDVFMDTFRTIDLPRSTTRGECGWYCSKSNKDVRAGRHTGANSEARPAHDPTADYAVPALIPFPPRFLAFL